MPFEEFDNVTMPGREFGFSPLKSLKRAHPPDLMWPAASDHIARRATNSKAKRGHLPGPPHAFVRLFPRLEPPKRGAQTNAKRHDATVRQPGHGMIVAHVIGGEAGDSARRRIQKTGRIEPRVQGLQRLDRKST